MFIYYLKEIDFSKVISEKRKGYGNEIQLTEKYTSENMGTFYKLIIGPIENDIANKLVSTFIRKGYKENEIILE